MNIHNFTPEVFQVKTKLEILHTGHIKHEILPPVTRQLSIKSSKEGIRTVVLEGTRLLLGRSESAFFSYPDDTLLSRSHLAFEPGEEEWSVTDLGSTNGSMLNGQKITGKRSLKPGDRVTAGNLTILYLTTTPTGLQSSGLEFTSDPISSTGTVAMTLERVLAMAKESSSSNRELHTQHAMRALMDAGRELAAHRPLEDLFQVIIQLATSAVLAKRGVLMTFDGPELVVSAAIGEGFRISRAVRTRVVEERNSILIADTSLDTEFREARTIVEQRVRSLIAVPLQTESKVIGLIYVDSPDVIRRFSADDLSLLTVMGNIAAVRIEHSRLLIVERAEQLMAKELLQAAEIQNGLFPQSAPVMPQLQLAGKSVPCRSVGGDYFDYLPLPDGKLVILVGDVAGKGMPASLLMTSLQARVHSLVEHYGDMAQLTTVLNKGVTAKCPPGKFITFFIALLDPTAGTISYSNAGHNPPMLIKSNGELTTLCVGGPVLGVLKSFTYEGETVPWEVGDTLLLYSDGVSEAMNPKEDEYGEDTLAEFLSKNRNQSASQLLDSIYETVTTFMDGALAADDITVVVAKRTA